MKEGVGTGKGKEGQRAVNHKRRSTPPHSWVCAENGRIETGAKSRGTAQRWSEGKLTGSRSCPSHPTGLDPSRARTVGETACLPTMASVAAHLITSTSFPIACSLESDAS